MADVAARRGLLSNPRDLRTDSARRASTSGGAASRTRCELPHKLPEVAKTTSRCSAFRRLSKSKSGDLLSRSHGKIDGEQDRLLKEGPPAGENGEPPSMRRAR